MLAVLLACLSLAVYSCSAEEVINYEEWARETLFTYEASEDKIQDLDRTLFIAIFVRNKEHSLPYFFKAIEDLDYDKKRIQIWIVCDHTRDDSMQLIESWTGAVKQQYAKVETEIRKGGWHYPKQKSDLSWSKERYLRLLELRQMALIKARETWAEFILYVDADNILMNPYTLRHLMDKKKVLIAPMLRSLSAYSNFWGGMTETGYYKRTDEYFPIMKNEKNGTFLVPMIHSTYLIDLRKKISRDVQFLPVRDEYKYDFDDVIIFATHCKLAGIELFIDNTVFYGYLPAPLDDDNTLEDEVNGFIHLRMEVMTQPPVGVGIEMKNSPYVAEKKIPKSNLGFDKIYVVNLKRRTDRRKRMKKVLQMQGIDYTLFDAVDSQNLNSTYLRKLGIEMMPGYVDPYRERGLTRGEIGCFLSHFTIWGEVIEKEFDKVMVLEDDVRFQPSFVEKLTVLMDRIKEVDMEWDLIYIGRKKLQNVHEPSVENVDGLVEVDYSYWTIGYLLSRTGAEKLVDGDPLGRMVPVDEYLPIMYDKHPISAYKDHFPKRDLIALSAEPMLIYPTHYTSEINYFSDTETSSIWDDSANNNTKPSEAHQEGKQESQTETDKEVDQEFETVKDEL